LDKWIDTTSEVEPVSEKVALFDLDGTLADFDGAMVVGLNALAAPGERIHTMPYEQDELPHMATRMRLIKQQPGFWSGLAKMKDGFLVLQMARELGYRLMVLSRGPRTNSAAWGEKLEWCRRNLPEDVQVTLTEDKGLVYGRVLVDDWPPYIVRWLEWSRRGLVIMPDRPWNKGYSHPQVIRFDYDSNNNEVYRALTERRI
jgi:FMN phosphatase YigB (HAD superfamily)